jgi:hypothetical protein
MPVVSMGQRNTSLAGYLKLGHATGRSVGGKARSFLRRCVSTRALREVVSFVPVHAG